MANHGKGAPAGKGGAPAGKGGEPQAEAAAEVAEGADLESTPLLPSDSRSSTSPKSGVEALDVLVHHFGFKLLVLLFASQHMMKGFAMTFIGPSTSFLYASYGVKAAQIQIFDGVTRLPWAMKPAIGLISDLLPIRGLHKAPYILITSFTGVIACGTIGVVPQESLSIQRVVLCLFLIQMQLSSVDLLSEAKYAEKMRSKPQHGPALMSFVWGGMQAAGLIATVFIGHTIQVFGAKAPYIVVLLPLSSILGPVMRNYLEEHRASAAEVAETRQRLCKQKEACGLCLLMFLGTMVLTLLGIFCNNRKIIAVASIGIALVMLISFSLVLKPIIAKMNAFFLLQTSLGVSISGAAFYFFNDTYEQYPEGPHFSKEFSTSVVGVVGAIFSLVGIWSYQRFASDWTYRRLLLVSNLVSSVLNLFDILLFARLNKQVGIDDHFFVLGSTALQDVILQWRWMPGVILLSQMCPKGMEATMYALLAGCHNLGNTIASNCGAVLLDYLRCQPSGMPGETHQFEHLWVGSAISTILPIFTLALLPWLIPDARQKERLLDEDDVDATEGSLLRRLTRRQ